MGGGNLLKKKSGEDFFLWQKVIFSLEGNVSCDVKRFMSYSNIPFALLLASAFPAVGAVSLTNSDSADFLGGSTNSHTFSGFDLSGGNAVAVALTFETVAGLGDYSISYGGEALTLAGSAIDTGAGAQTSAIFYLLNPASSVGDLTISVPPWDRFAASVVALNNVGGVGTIATAGGTTGGETLSLNYSASAGDYLFAAAIDNSWGGSGIVPTFSGDNSTDAVELVGVSGSANPEGGTGHYGSTIAADGTFASLVGTGGNSSRNSAALLVFEDSGAAIPEPSVSLLGGLGLLALLRRRR